MKKKMDLSKFDYIFVIGLVLLTILLYYTFSLELSWIYIKYAFISWFVAVIFSGIYDDLQILG